MKLKKVLASVMAALMVMSSTVNAFATDPIPTVPEGGTTPTEEVVIEEPVVDEPEVDPVKDLFDKLMVFETYEALDAYMTDEMTEEDYVLLGQFSDEQNAALSARVAELQENEVEQLAPGGSYPSYPSYPGYPGYPSYPGGNDGSYPLEQKYYNGNLLVYWDVMTATDRGGYIRGDSNRVQTVTLGGTTINKENSDNDPWQWRNGTKLSDCYGDLDNQDDPKDAALRVVPAAGYYVTKVIVACCGLNQPYNCQTWSDGKTFTKTFSLTASGVAECSIPSNSFGHASNETLDNKNYFILIETAPLPSPLYVEYDCGKIEDALGDTFAESIFNDADGWLAPATEENYLGSDGRIDTEYTQYRYCYEEHDEEDVENWKHYANTVTDDAIDAAKVAGYTFAGWAATYYNECEVSEPVARANNLIYNFDDQYSDGSTPYAEGASVALTTHVKLEAQWKEIQTTEATVKKVWDDADNQDGKRPTSLTVTLSNGTEIVATKTLNEENKWTAIVEELPIYDEDGKEITYTWSEGAVAGYTLTNTSKEGTVTTLTNTHTPETTSATVRKVWEDNNNANGNRPASLTVTLSNGTDTVETVTLNEANKWTATVENLPKYADGEEIVYTWTEGAMPEGYTLTSTSKEGTVTTLTNSYNLPLTSATVIKVWDDADNQDGKRPESLIVTLSNGTTVTLNEGNQWTATVEGLPAYKNGQAVTYTWTEGEMPEGYELTNTSVDDTVTTLTNSYEPEVTEATVVKVWEDANNQDGKRPTELKVTLSNGTEVTLSEKNQWTATVENLPKYADGKVIEYTWTEGKMPEGYTLTDTSKEGTVTTLTNSYTPEVTEATVLKIWDDTINQDGIRPESLKVTLSNGTEVTLNKANGWTATVKDLPKYANGQLITYTWTENEEGLPEGYKLSNTSVNGTVTTLTNSYTPEETKATVKKVWNDADNQDGIRPASLKVTLSNGTEVTLNEANGWTATVEGLPKFAAGVEIAYTWTEGTVPEGYTLTSSTSNNETILINTHVPENTEATVKKVWDDAEDQDGKRPESLTVTLSDGTAVVLNEENEWTATVENLPKYANGQEIKYTWTEATVDGYTAADPVVNGTTTTLTNTHTPETTSVTVNKVWEDEDNKHGFRPESITINLYKEVVAAEEAPEVLPTMLAEEPELIKVESVEVSANTQWTYTFTDLPKYEDGVEIVYSITEDDVNGYSSEIEESENGFTVTNSINEFILNVNKKWIGNTGSEVEVQILRGSEVLDTVKLNANNEWKAETTIYGSMEAINVKEVKVPSNYHASYSNISSADENGQYNVTVTNTYIEEDPEIPDEPGKKFVVKKIWVDDNEAVRPESIKVQLYKNGKAYGRAVTLSADNNWRYVWTDLPDSDKINWTVKETVVPVGYVASIEEVRSNHHYIYNTYKPVKENVNTGA